MKKLLKNCALLVKENGQYKMTEDCFLLIDGDTISYIGTEAPNEDMTDVWTKDMHGMLVMQGFANTHGHTPMTLLRSVGSGLSLQNWLHDEIFPVEEKLTPDDVAVGQAVGILEMLACGTTMVADMYDFPWAAGKVLMESGMKANICRVGLSFSENELFPPQRYDECVDLVRNFRDPYKRVIPCFCIHSEYLSNEILVRKIADINRDLKANVHVHVSETQREHWACIDRRGGLTPVQYFENCGLLEQNTYMAHCVWATEEDLAIIKKHNATLVHCPSSNMKLGSGFAPIKKAVDMGVNVAIGTDGCASNDNLNIFEETHLAALIHKGINHSPTVLSASQLIDMATVNGARAMGFTDSGEIAAGKKADLIAVDISGVHMKPCFDIANLLVYSAQGSDVRMTMVDGNILYEDGEYFTIDQEKVRYEFKKCLGRLY